MASDSIPSARNNDVVLECCIYDWNTVPMFWILTIPAFIQSSYINCGLPNIHAFYAGFMFLQAIN